MLHVQLPPPMPSTLASEHTNLHGIRPPLPQLRGIDFEWETKGLLARAGKGAHWPEGGRSEAGGAVNHHGLHTPPRDMTARHGNPLLGPNVEGLQYQRVPAVASNPHQSQTAQRTLDVTRQPREPFYNTYYSAKQRHSPHLPKKEKVATSEESARRRLSSDANSIASHLQIPSSINNSKESLPEFAAQVSQIISHSDSEDGINRPYADYLFLLVRVFIHHSSRRRLHK